MKGVFVFAMTGLIIFSFLSFDDRNLAHAAEYDNFGNYVCPTDRDWLPAYTGSEIAKIDYEDRVYAFNDGVESRSGSIEELNRLYIQPGSTVDDLNQMTTCLYETHHIDPDSVATFSDKAQAVLSYDMEKLVMTFPDLANYAEVPEFNSLASVTMIVSVLGAMLIHKRFQR